MLFQQRLAPGLPCRVVGQLGERRRPGVCARGLQGGGLRARRAVLRGHDDDDGRRLIGAGPDSGQRHGQAARAHGQRVFTEQADGARQAFQVGIGGGVNHDRVARLPDARGQRVGRIARLRRDVGAAQQGGDVAFGHRRDRIGRGRGLGDRLAVHIQNALFDGAARGRKGGADHRHRVRAPGVARRVDLGLEGPAQVVRRSAG
ncbi:hypothetical protein G6F68_014633 [Rhizopus microsporus]|nr:hypothetical protein G6F68_014633 [Rhizopus microsporus]